jgi:hypothetical protein
VRLDDDEPGAFCLLLNCVPSQDQYHPDRRELHSIRDAQCMVLANSKQQQQQQQQSQQQQSQQRPAQHNTTTRATNETRVLGGARVSPMPRQAALPFKCARDCDNRVTTILLWIIFIGVIFVLTSNQDKFPNYDDETKGEWSSTRRGWGCESIRAQSMTVCGNPYGLMQGYSPCPSNCFLCKRKESHYTTQQ